MPRQFSFALTFLLGLALLVMGCDTPDDVSDDATPDDERVAAVAWPHTPSYQVFVHSFADGTGDGIGDFQGLTAKLDYIDDLGVDAMWLLPIHPSPTYHKYDVTNYWEIHPDYGTMEDFETFLDEAHARDLRVVIDLVVNHTSNEHPWFQEALADTTSPFFDFYIWGRGEDIESIMVDETGPDSDNLQRWNPVDHLPGLYYYSYFWSGMPDLNYDNPVVKDSIFAIGRHWLEKGVDGFRLDAAKHIFPEHRMEDNHAWWDEFRAEMEEVNPDVYLVGEVWDSPETIAPFLTGLPAQFNFDIAYGMWEGVERGVHDSLVYRHANIREAYREVTDDFIDATFITNHDQDRFLSVLDDEAKARVTTALLFTLPGAPYIYYGEEIGMRGMKPDEHIREPMLWAPQDEDEMRTTWIEPEYSTDETVDPVSVQEEDEDSMLNYYRQMIAMRNDSPALSIGELVTTEDLHEALVLFERVHEDERLLVAHNVSGEALEIELGEAHRAAGDVVYQSHDDAEIRDGILHLGPHASLVVGL